MNMKIIVLTTITIKSSSYNVCTPDLQPHNLKVRISEEHLFQVLK